MTDKEMFERSFQRPSNYFQLTPDAQWEIDAQLGILDWEGGKLTPEEFVRFCAHYDMPEKYNEVFVNNFKDILA